MSDGWFPASDGTWDEDDEEAQEWPAPSGPSEWQLFKKWSTPKIVMTDAAINAMAAGDPDIDNILITFEDDRMLVEASMGVWDHILHALYAKELTCRECEEILDVFRRVNETLEEEDEPDGTL